MDALAHETDKLDCCSVFLDISRFSAGINLTYLYLVVLQFMLVYLF